MLTLSVDNIKGLFFDAPAVQRAVDRAELKALSKVGAYVRTSARSLIRKKKSPSTPGQPPRNVTGLLRKFLFFAYDPQTHSVVIGPAAINAKHTEAPHVLEYGGQTTGTVRWKFPESGPRRGSKPIPVRGPVRIAARPYMQPALDANSDLISNVWKGSIKR